MHRHPMCLVILACMLGSDATLWAENVDLSTVPDRATVQLTIYNSEDLTLVREARKVSFKKGPNPLQFSWANTLIDPTSVELHFRTQPDKLVLLDTTFPHAKPQMLYWNVQSEFDGEATIEISYFTSGITWTADYTAIANRAETTLHLDGHVRVFNHSGEDYEDAQVRLVVGTINLVEKIAQLANITVEQAAAKRTERKAEFELAGKSVFREIAAVGDKSNSLGSKQIIKEGLSEYFIFTIPGTETIPHGWSKRMRAVQAEQAPFKIQYRYRPRMYGEQLTRLYLLTNDQPSKLGESPLPDGVVRVFRDNGRDGLSYLAQQVVKYIPIGDKIEVPLGPDPEVVFELVKRRGFRDQIWVHWNDGKIVQRADDRAVTIDFNAQVVGWDDHEIFTQRIRNYSGKAIEVEVERPFDGHVVFRSSLNPRLFDFRTPAFTTTVKPAEKKEHLFEIVRHQGRNAKQNNVTLEAAEVQR